MADRAKRAWRMALAALVWAAATGSSAVSADELTVPSPVERDSPLTAAYRFDQPAAGHGSLDVEWTDVDGRVVDRRHIPLDLANAAQVTFHLDMRRAVTVVNRLAAHLSLDGVDQGGAPVRRRTDLSASFIASPPDQGWRDYQIIMWQGQTPAAYRTLRRLGITAGRVAADHRPGATYVAADLALLLDQDLRFYLESIAPDFYSPYHRWSGDLPVNWRFLAAEARHRRKPDDIAAFIRNPSLSDPRWLAKIRTRLTRDVQALRPYRPLYYNLGDETGIAELASFWDFDFSNDSLAAMREWLQQHYGSLPALNQEWGSHFKRWAEVAPMTTRQAIRQSDQNFAAWADFKEWMDVAFARALAAGAAAVHTADPGALAAIEGVQVPGWGGYDYPRLARSVDAMEPYDFGDDIEMLRSFNPKLVLLTTLFASGAQGAYLTWRELLRGTSGLILWDEANGFAAKDGSLGERGLQAAPYFAQIRNGLGALLINSRRHTDPVAVLYSQASLRIAWLLDRRARGERKNGDAEALGAAPRNSWQYFVQAVEHLGVEPRFVSAAALESGALRAGGPRILMLPDAIALSSDEARQIREFVARGGVVLADGEPGLFDEHGRRLEKAMLSDVFAGPPEGATTRFAFGRGTAIYISFPDGAGPTSARHIADILAAAGVEARFPVARAGGGRAGDIETHAWDNGPATILAVQRDLSASPGAISAPTEPNPTGREAVVVRLPRRLDVYDLRTRHALGKTDRVALDLGPGEPVILALSPTPLAAPVIAGPAAARLGETAELHIRLGSPEAPGVVHVDAVDPEDRVVLPYSGNLLAAHGEAVKLLPLAVNDKSGVWKIRATDVLSGQTATAELRVEP